LLNIILHDDSAVRQWFLQAIYGEGEHKNIDLDPIERAVRGEYRQWYGYEKDRFTSIGAGYSEINFKAPSDPLPDDIVRRFDCFALLITELDEQGWWRLSLAGAFNSSDIDFTSFPAGGGVQKRNAKIDFFRVEARLIFEVVTNVDVTAGAEVVTADQHDFDNVSVLGQVALFNFGPYRAEFGARGTHYHNLDLSLGTMFMEVNFAQ